MTILRLSRHARNVMSLFLIFSSIGCQTPTREPTAGRSLESAHQVTLEHIETAKQRIHLLRAEMTNEEVFASLGLSSYIGNHLANSGGPYSHSWASYTLSDGYALNIVREITGPQVSTLRSVSLDGTIWRRIKKE